MMGALNFRGIPSKLLGAGLPVSGLALCGPAPAPAQEATGKNPTKEATNKAEVVTPQVDDEGFLAVHLRAMRDGCMRSLCFVEGLKSGAAGSG